MECFEAVFDHLTTYRIIYCRQCRYAVVPSQVQTHLTKAHPRISTGERQSIATFVWTLKPLARTENEVVYPKPTDPLVDGFPVWHDGLRCQWKDEQGVQCRALYRTIYRAQQHCKEQHGWVNAQRRGGDKRSQRKDTTNKLWKEGRACQQFFKASQWKRYFEVEGQEDVQHKAHRSARNSEHSTAGKGRAQFFRDQEDSILQSQQDATEQANRVHGFEDHRSTVVPWLRATGIAEHIRGLHKDEIRTAISLPSENEEPRLYSIVESMEGLLHEAHSWCFDGPECMLTWPCRVVLNRFQPSNAQSSGKIRPFDPYKEPASLKGYIRVAKQCLAYFARVAVGRQDHFINVPEGQTSRPEEAIDLTVEQLQKWRKIRQLARQGEADDDLDSQVGLKDELLDLWMLLISHKIGARRYSSPILSFCAMLSIKPSTSTWIEAGNFNSHLSKIIWVVQLLIFYDSARKERAGQGETLELVTQCCDRHLQQTVEGPMGEVLRWRLLLFHIAKNDVGQRQAEWDESEEVLTFEGVELHMDQIPTLLLSEHTECRTLLYEELMFGVADIPRMHAWALKDSPNVDNIDWNFTHHRGNAHLLHNAKRALLATIERSDRLSRLFLAESGDSSNGFVWRENAIASYEAIVQRFLYRLCTLVHVSGGQPLRESEFFSMTWRNTQRPRSITIRHEKVMIHVKYHKGQQQTGRYKDNIRFLAHPVADLLLDYIIYVLPLRQLFARQSAPQALLSPFVWEKDGSVWAENRLSRCLEDSSTRAQIPRLHISNWRQMTVAIVKTKFASDTACFESDEDDEDAEEMDVNIRAMTVQRNHKTRTVNRAYANQTGSAFGNVWDGMVRKALRASTMWQDFWGVDLLLRDKKRKRVEEDSIMAKQIAMGVYRPRKQWSGEALLAALRRLYRDRQIEWKSPEQEQAMSLIMSGTEQVVAILPTGAGKSLLFILPCTLPGAGTTILVVPLVALRGDLLRRLRELGIDHIEWRPGESREAALVMVSVEAVPHKEFMSYARDLVNRQRLDRIVFDECHLTVTAVEYRQSIADMTVIRCLRTQFVYLTATLSPTIRAEFEERNYLLRPSVVRAASNRPNLFYTVYVSDAKQESLLEQGALEAREAWEGSELFDRRRDKIVVYVHTRKQAEVLAALLDCEAYTAESGSKEEKSLILRRWIESSVRPYIVATVALAEGFDYPHVRLVLNIGAPDSLSTFAQQSGRAGRDGETAYSMVLLPSGWEASDDVAAMEEEVHSLVRDSSLRKKRDILAVHRYLRSDQCRRTSLSEYLDALHHRRWCMEEDVACDVCKVGHKDRIPPREQVMSRSTNTGAALIQAARLRMYSELERYRSDLEAVRGTCLFCRAYGDPWDHTFSRCSQRFAIFEQRRKARQRHERRKGQWLKPYTACFWCLNPQSICQRAEIGIGKDGDRCEHIDIVLPICYGVWQSVEGADWLYECFKRQFTNVEDYFDWLAEVSEFGGGKAIQAVRVAAERLALYR